MFSADPITDGRIVTAIIVFGVTGCLVFAWWLAGFADDKLQQPSPFTHKGWYWFCPIYLGQDGPDGLVVEARWAVLEPLFALAALCDQVRIFLSSALIPGYEPSFMFKITGKLDSDSVDDDFSGFGI